jgi:RimJ/RimL family protein N-acetyltransferase
MDIETINSFWAYEYFGCSISDIKNSRDIVCPHLYLKGYNGIFIMRINNKYIISTPEEKVFALSKITNCGLDLFDICVLQKALNDEISRYIGPCWIGYFDDTSDFITNSTQILTKSDIAWESVFEDLQKNCDKTEWSYSGIDKKLNCIAVQYNENKIVAAAPYVLWGNKVAHIGVITHPDFRNKGFGTNVITAITKAIKEKGLIPQYRTLCLNMPAIRAAIKCGYKEFAYHISVRLKPTKDNAVS